MWTFPDTCLPFPWAKETFTVLLLLQVGAGYRLLLVLKTVLLWLSLWMGRGHTSTSPVAVHSKSQEIP